MKQIFESELLKFEESLRVGSCADIFKCYYNGNIYAYKKFHVPDDLLNNLHRIKNLSQLKINGSLLPIYLVSDKDNLTAYLTKWGSDASLDQIIDNVKYDIKLEILKNLKNNLLELHNHNIIHGDIHFGNVLVDINNNSTHIIDFDNCAYDNFKINNNICSLVAQTYIKKYGINKELDIFLFNRLAFEIINNLGYNEVDNYILNGSNYYFKSCKEYYEICDTMLLNRKKPTDKFLIDFLEKKLVRGHYEK